MSQTGIIGIIGGSGFYNMAGISDVREVEVETPFGKPSDPVRLGKLGGRDVAFIARHGRGHRYNPTNVPARANIFALKTLGVTHLISVSAVGSMKEEIEPLHMVVPNQLFDRTVHRGGTYICIEGPQFSTQAESIIYRGWGISVIGMTALPEARLAREAEMCYATLAMTTDYDTWHPDHDSVTVDLVVSNLNKNVQRAKDTVAALVPAIASTRTCTCDQALASSIMTTADLIPDDVKKRLEPLIGKYI